MVEMKARVCIAFVSQFFLQKKKNQKKEMGKDEQGHTGFHFISL